MQVKHDTKPKPQFPRIQPAMLDRLEQQAEKLSAPPKEEKRTASRWPRLRVW